MVKSESGLSVDINERMRGGEGSVEVHNLFEKEDFFDKGRVFGVFYIEPGNSIGYHKHVGEQEAYYIIEGQGLYNDNGIEKELNPGDVAYCKDGESHGIMAIGDKTLKYIGLIMYTV